MLGLHFHFLINIPKNLGIYWVRSVKFIFCRLIHNWWMTVPRQFPDGDWYWRDLGMIQTWNLQPHSYTLDRGEGQRVKWITSSPFRWSFMHAYVMKTRKQIESGFLELSERWCNGASQRVVHPERTMKLHKLFPVFLFIRTFYRILNNEPGK